MDVYSQLPKEEYLKHMKSRMGSFWKWGDERFTGFFLGNFFYVTYHSGYEWNRRITNEKNRAMGFILDRHGSTSVHFIRTRGYGDPFSVISLFLLFFAVCAAMIWFMNLYDKIYYFHEIWLPFALGVSIFETLLIAVSSVFRDGITERGIWGRYMLMALLHHPEDPENHIEQYD